MNSFGPMSTLLIGLGSLLIIVGLIFKFLPEAGLPGDIIIQRKNMTIFFPVASCIVISILLSLFFHFFRR